MKLLLKAAIRDGKWEVAAHMVVIGLVRASHPTRKENADEHRPKTKKERKA